MSYAGMANPGCRVMGWVPELKLSFMLLVACVANPQIMRFVVASGAHIEDMKIVRVLPPRSNTVEKTYAAVNGRIALLPFMPWPPSSLSPGVILLCLLGG